MKPLAIVLLGALAYCSRASDTDALTLIQKRAGEAFESLAAYLDDEDDDVSVTIISFEEQIRGWMSLIARAKSPRRN